MHLPMHTHSAYVHRYQRHCERKHRANALYFFPFSYVPVQPSFLPRAQNGKTRPHRLEQQTLRARRTEGRSAASQLLSFTSSGTHLGTWTPDLPASRDRAPVLPRGHLLSWYTGSTVSRRMCPSVGPGKQGRRRGGPGERGGMQVGSMGS